MHIERLKELAGIKLTEDVGQSKSADFTTQAKDLGIVELVRPRFWDEKYVVSATKISLSEPGSLTMIFTFTTGAKHALAFGEMVEGNVEFNNSAEKLKMTDAQKKAISDFVKKNLT